MPCRLCGPAERIASSGRMMFSLLRMGRLIPIPPPEKALACYRELIETTTGTRYSFAEIIHAHVDIAMSTLFQSRGLQIVAKEGLFSRRRSTARLGHI